MNARTLISTLLALSFVASAASISWTAGASTDQNPPAEIDTRRVKAIFHGAIPLDIELWADLRGGTVVLRHEMLQLVAFRLGDAVNSEDFLTQLRARTDVKWANYDGFARPQHDPNDAKYSGQYALPLIGMPVAWDIEKGSYNVINAILDSGVHSLHEDLQTPCDPYCSPAPADLRGHGTNVAGVAAAQMDNNRTGMAGVAQTRIMSIKVTDDATGNSAWSVVAAAIYDAAANGADVITFSYSNECDYLGEMLCLDVALAIDEAWSLNTLVVAATGNDAKTNWVGYPARFDRVIAVGMVDSTKTRHVNSNGGPGIDLVAPGVSVLTTAPPVGVKYSCVGVDLSEYCLMTGTSIAAPHVSGVIGLIRSKCPDLSNTQVASILNTTAEGLGSPGWDNLYGWGLLRADLALNHTLVQTC